jgi:hypothetical protein
MAKHGMKKREDEPGRGTRKTTQVLPITYVNGNQQDGIRLKVIRFDDPAFNDWLDSCGECAHGQIMTALLTNSFISP